MNRRRFLQAATGALLLPAFARAGLITQSGPRLFVPPSQEASGLAFPLHSPAYLSVMPGLGGVGMETPGGMPRGAGTPTTAKFLIDDLGTGNVGSQRPELGPNVYSGTFEYCWRANFSPKCANPIISGWVHGNSNVPLQTGTPPRDGFFTFNGASAPPAGFWLRGIRPHLNGASDCVVMHMRSGVGDDSGGLNADNLDPIGSGYAGGVTARIILLHNWFGFSTDEVVDHYRAHTQSTWMYNIFGPALMDGRINHAGDPTDEPHGFGPTFGGDSSDTGSLTMARNLFFDMMGRGPAVTATSFCAANNLYYNAGGRPGGGNSEAIDIWSQNQSNERVANILWNWFIRGPEHTNTPIAVRVRAGTAGAIGHLEGNAAHGWTMANQAAFLNSAVSGWEQGELTAAIPGSWGGLSGVLQQTPSTTEEWEEIVDLMDAHVGACSKTRIPGTAEHRVFEQIRARLAGGSTSHQYVDTVQEWTGNADMEDPYWPVTSKLINPLDPDPEDDWVGPMPLAAGSDTPYTSGTFSNGMSREGRSPWEVWNIEQSWRRSVTPSA